MLGASLVVFALNVLYKSGFIKAIQRNTVFQGDFGELSVKGRAESNNVGEFKAMFAKCL